MKKIIILSLCSLFLLCSCGKTSYLDTNSDESAVQEVSRDILEAQMADPTELIETGEAKDVTEDIYVHVCGSVKTPGVYVLGFDSRVYEAVEAAGGFAEDADENCLNMATKLSDGERIYVYAMGELEAETLKQSGGALDSALDDARVSINTADVRELMTLPGIGESKANKIVTYREENGSFSSPEDIMKVSGIGEGIYAEIKENIKL